MCVQRKDVRIYRIASCVQWGFMRGEGNNCFEVYPLILVFFLSSEVLRDTTHGEILQKILSKQSISFPNEILLWCFVVSVLGILKCSLCISVIFDPVILFGFTRHSSCCFYQLLLLNCINVQS